MEKHKFEPVRTCATCGKDYMDDVHLIPMTKEDLAALAMELTSEEEAAFNDSLNGCTCRDAGARGHDYGCPVIASREP